MSVQRVLIHRNSGSGRTTTARSLASQSEQDAMLEALIAWVREYGPL